MKNYIILAHNFNLRQEHIMNFSRIAGLTISVLMLIPAIAFAEITSITVKVKNLSPPTGTVEVTLFNSAETFMQEPYRQHSGTIGEDGEYKTVFTDLTAGEYAVVVAHDANDNGKLDPGFLGFGGEGYGFSNKASSWFGRPDYEDVKIMTDPAGTLVEIDFE